jgi:hypothetical protein
MERDSLYTKPSYTPGLLMGFGPPELRSKPSYTLISVYELEQYCTQPLLVPVPRPVI